MYTVEINDAEIGAAFASVAASLGDMTPFTQSLGELLLQSTQDRMLRGEQPDGAPFAPRSQATLDHYARTGQTPRGGPLNLTGMMIAGIAFQAGPDYLEIGSNAIQAAVMQFGAMKGAFGTTSRGGPIPWGTIPARPFLGLSDEDRTNILDELSDYVGEALHRPR